MKDRLEKIINNRWLVFSSRLVLGGIFITASISKLQLQTKFVNTVISYGILPDSLAQIYGFTLPWVELFMGCSLVLGLFYRFNAALTIPTAATPVNSVRILAFLVDAC